MTEPIDLDPVRFDTDEVEPVAAPAAGRPTRREIIIGVTAAAIAIVLTIVAGISGAAWTERRDLIDDYRLASSTLSEARQSYEAADVALAEARGAVRGITAIMGPLLELSGEPIPAEATAALAASRETALIDIAAPTPPRAYAVVAQDPDELDNAALVAEQPLLLDAATRLGTATRYRERLAAGAERLAAELGTAFADYLHAVVDRGVELLEARSDASSESRMALQSAIEALPTAATEDVEEIVEAAMSAAADVIATSNRARIDDPSSITVVVNKHRPLQPVDFAPEIVWADVPYGFAPEMRPDTAAALAAMFADFTAETGEQLLAQSSYRSYDDQVYTYNSCVTNLGYTQAERACARPGHSEHQTGLTVDVAAVGWGCLIQECFGGMLPGQWLADHGWRHGFIVRYPDGYEHITGFAYEPWHMRFVGVEVATDLRERGLATLEEYYGLDPAPEYL